MRIHHGIGCLLCIVFLHACAAGTRTTPPHLLGIWSTAESLFSGDTEQSQLYIAADGLGLIVGSSKPPQRMDGTPLGQNARVVLGFPLRVAVTGDTLTARLIIDDPREAHEVERSKIICHYEVAGPALRCVMPLGPPVRMIRRSAALHEESEDMLAETRARHP